jgi:hypothetical protein
MENIMQKKLSSEALNLANLTLPFLMITVTFISIAYLYGHTTPQASKENVFESSRINISTLLQWASKIDPNSLS